MWLERGAASGVLTTAQQFASALGIAVIGGIFFHVLGHGLAGFGHALGTAVWYELGLVLIGIALSVLLGRLARR
jgi:hypothetical protein